jgi:hypothetical protein
MGAGPGQGQVVPGEAGDLGHARAAGEHEEHQEPVTAAGPGFRVRGCEKGVGLVPGQPGDRLAGRLARLDGQDPGDERGVLGVAEGRMQEQGVDRGEPLAAGPARVVPLVFEHCQEPGYRRGVDVGEIEAGGPGAALLADPSEQEPERVAVGRDGVRAGAALGDEVVGEERFDGGGESGHRKSPPW